MKKQSTTVLSFDANEAADRSYHLRFEEVEKLSQEAALLEAMAEPSENSGTGLLRFCRELSVVLIKKYLVGNDPAEVRQELVYELIARIQCSSAQANHLVDLALEIIHVHVHGKYRRNELDLTCLIAKATGAVGDVSMN